MGYEKKKERIRGEQKKSVLNMASKTETEQKYRAKEKYPRNFFFLEDQTSPRATKNKTKIVSKHKKLSVSEQTF